MSQFHSNVYSSYFLPFVVVEHLKDCVKSCESFRTSLIFPLTVLTTEDTTSLHKSSTEKNDVNGNTIDMLIDDRILYYLIIDIQSVNFIVFHNPRKIKKICARVQRCWLKLTLSPKLYIACRYTLAHN